MTKVALRVFQENYRTHERTQSLPTCNHLYNEVGGLSKNPFTFLKHNSSTMIYLFADDPILILPAINAKTNEYLVHAYFFCK